MDTRADSAGSADDARPDLGTDLCRDLCPALERQYAEAFTEARVCEPGQADQCMQLADQTLPCGCPARVDDKRKLDELRALWTGAGCASCPHVCAAVVCLVPGPGSCQPASTGHGTCARAPL